jgi:putative FmdB family regulatory protein
MPIYEYQCSACGHEFEVLIRNASDHPAKYPACKRGKPVKALSTFAVASAAIKSVAERCGACPSSGGGCATEGGSCCGLRG